MSGYLEIARRAKKNRGRASYLANSPEEAEHWNKDKAVDVVKGTLMCLNAHYVEGADLCFFDPYEDEIDGAFEAEDMAALRAAARGLVRVGLREFERQNQPHWQR